MVYNKFPKIRNSKGAIELSIGTVVIIVLAMTMLILGILLIRNIFGTATGAITEIDQGVKNEINKLFSENQDKILVLYPDSGIIEIEQGSQDAGFVVALRNTDNNQNKDFQYEVTYESKGSCQNDPMTAPRGAATDPARVIVGGQSSSAITLTPNKVMENPIHVRIGVSDTAPTCTFRLKVSVTEGSNNVATGYMDVEITPG